MRDRKGTRNDFFVVTKENWEKLLEETFGLGGTEMKDKKEMKSTIRVVETERKAERLADRIEPDWLVEEIIERATEIFDIPPQAMHAPVEGESPCGMTPEELDRARATIAYLVFVLRLEECMKESGAHATGGGWVALGVFKERACRHIAFLLDIVGSEEERTDEVKRLFDVCQKAMREDEGYRKKIEYLMQDLEEEFGFDPEEEGVVFVPEAQ